MPGVMRFEPIARKLLESQIGRRTCNRADHGTLRVLVAVGLGKWCVDTPSWTALIPEIETASAHAATWLLLIVPTADCGQSLIQVVHCATSSGSAGSRHLREGRCRCFAVQLPYMADTDCSLGEPSAELSTVLIATFKRRAKVAVANP